MAQNSDTYENGLEVHRIDFCDNDVNRFRYVEMSIPNDGVPPMRQFIITSANIHSEKQKSEESKKTSEMLSDL